LAFRQTRATGRSHKAHLGALASKDYGQDAERDTFGFGQDSDSDGEDDGKQTSFAHRSRYMYTRLVGVRGLL
jgi:hypothetical protein